MYLRREGDRDGLATFYPVYTLKSCTARRNENDTHMCVLLVTGHPVRLFANRRFRKLEDGIVELVTGRGVLWTHSGHKRTCACDYYGRKVKKEKKRQANGADLKKGLGENVKNSHFHQ